MLNHSAASTTAGSPNLLSALRLVQSGKTRLSRNRGNLKPVRIADYEGGLTMTKTMHGTVRGRTIELEEDPGVADSQKVEIQVKVVPQPAVPGDGLLRTEGALVDDEECDAIMAEIHQARKLERLCGTLLSRTTHADSTGNCLPTADLMIGSVAMVHNLTLVWRRKCSLSRAPADRASISSRTRTL